MPGREATPLDCQLAKKLRRFLGQISRQLPGRHLATKGGSLPGPERCEIARAIGFGFSAERCDRRRSKRKCRGVRGHRAKLAHGAVNEATRWPAGEDIRERSPIVACFAKGSRMRRRNLSLWAEQIRRADLNGGSAKRKWPPRCRARPLCRLRL